MGFLKEVEARVNLLEKKANLNLDPELPIVMRFDGSSFSKFTKGLKEPFDQRLTDLMIECCKYMVEITNARCGFVGSDEITIVIWEESENPKGKFKKIFHKILNFFNKKPQKSRVIYNGRVQKLLSELPSKLSVRFNKLLPKYLPEKTNLEPYFDARAWNVPSPEDATFCLWMREESVIKNAITMACVGNNLMSSKSILNKNGAEKIEMLREKGVEFEDYPVAFKRGVYVQRKKEFRTLTNVEIEELHEKHHARKNPNLQIERTTYKVLELPKFTNIENKTDVIMFGKEPKLYETMQP